MNDSDLNEMQKREPSEHRSRDTYWSRLSDEDLLKVTFTTDDPERLENLSATLPPNNNDPRVEFAYDFRRSKHSKIQCAHCRYPNHLAGFVMKTDDGLRFLVGHECGWKIYGADFNLFRKDFDAARYRANNLRRMEKLKAALPAFLRWLDETGRDPIWQTHRETHLSIRQTMPRFWGALTIAVQQDGGVLRVWDHVRDFRAEERDEERYEREMADWNGRSKSEKKALRRGGQKPRPPRTPIFTRVERQVGRVPAQDLFRPRCNLKETFDSIAMQFEVLRERTMNNPSTSAREVESTRSMTSTFKQVNDRLRQLEDLIKRLAALPMFFQPGSLAAAAEWMNQQDDPKGVYRADVTRILCDLDDEETVEISMPATYRVPSIGALVAFRDAVNQR